MIRQNMGPDSFRNRTGRSNEGRKLSDTERQNNRNYNRSANLDLVGMVKNFLGGGSGQPDMQTTTQQNLPSWAIPDAMSTLAMGNYYTQNPDYRPSTLDRDYSGLRGYDPTGRPNSQVGQFGLNPRGYSSTTPGTNLDGTDPYRPNDINNLVAQLPPDMQRQTGGPLMRAPLSGRGMGRSTGWFWGGDDSSDDSSDDSGWSWEVPQIDLPDLNFDSLVEDTWLDNRPQSDPGELAYPTSLPETPTQSPQGDIRPDGSNSEGQGYPTGNDSPTTQTQPTSSENQSGNTNTQTNTTTETTTVDPKDIFNPDDLTPFQAYDRQRFAAPGQDTLRGEGILAGRYDQRFGPGGTDPFAAANQAVGTAANYQSGFQGTMGEGGLGGQAGNYQQGLGSATNPNVFQSGNYTSGLPNFANPNADMRNVNAGIGNVNAGVQNVNAGLRSQQFGNANQALQGPVNYQQQRSLRDSMQQFQDPYTDRVVNQTIKDMDRARQMTANQISGDSAKAGAYGGSRSMLMQAENNRNFADRTAAAVGQLRSQGFQRAADLAQQENLQRLGLSASDIQQARGLQSQGNLQGQNLTARDLQDVRGLQSQGALTAQGLRSQGGLAAQGLRSQGGLAAQGLQSQGALAALGANAGLYQSALGLNAAGDRSAMGYNAGLLSDAMGLDAADLQQRRNLASNEAQFAETANRGAGALNLQGGQALGQLAQAGTADERQRIADLLASGGAGDARNQQDLDFIFSEFNRELDYPGRQIDLRNAAISPATGSIVTTSQPRYQQSPLAGPIGTGLTAYGATGNPYIALGLAAADYLI